jgi:hypothetical protein
MDLPAQNGLGSAKALRACLEAREVETRPGNTDTKHRTIAEAP